MRRKEKIIKNHAKGTDLKIERKKVNKGSRNMVTNLRDLFGQMDIFGISEEEKFTRSGQKSVKSVLVAA